MQTNNTRPALADILRDIIKSWLADEPVITTGYPTLYNTLLSKQHAAGWEQLFLGRFVNEWREIQEAHLTRLPTRDKHQTGMTWVTKIISIIWKHVYLLWEIRNAAQHGIDAESREAILLATAIRETESLYDIREEVRPRDKDLYYRTIEEHCEQEPTSRGMRQWLNTWKPVLLHSLKEGRRLGTAGMRSIQQYLQPTITQPTPPNFTD